MAIAASSRGPHRPAAPAPSQPSAAASNGSAVVPAAPSVPSLPARFEIAEQVSLFGNVSASSRHTLLNDEGRRIGLVTHNPQVGTKLEDDRGVTVALVGRQEGFGHRKFAIYDGQGKRLGSLSRRASKAGYELRDSEDRLLARVEDKSAPLSRGKVLVVMRDRDGEELVRLQRYPMRSLVWDRWKVDQKISDGLDPRLWVMLPVLEGGRRG